MEGKVMSCQPTALPFFSLSYSNLGFSAITRTNGRDATTLIFARRSASMFVIDAMGIERSATYSGHLLLSFAQASLHLSDSSSSLSPFLRLRNTGPEGCSSSPIVIVSLAQPHM